MTVGTGGEAAGGMERDRTDPPGAGVIGADRFFETKRANETPTMTDAPTPNRTEPIMDPGPVPEPARPDVPPVPVATPSQAAVAAPAPLPGRAAPSERAAGGVADQLARLEDKTARIEEKLARFEAANQRVVDRFEMASARMSEVAQQSDLSAVRGEVAFVARRVRNMPGLSALVATALATIVLTAALTAIVFRYMPGVLPR